MRLRLALTLALATLTGCRSCRDDDSVADAALKRADAAHTTQLAAPLPFEALPTARGFGLPAGCRLELPVRNALLPKGSVRFSAARSTLDELALAVGDPDGGTAAASAWLALDQKRAQPLPWTMLDEPPALARSDNGIIAARERPAEGSLRTALVWRSAGPEDELAEGDQLWIADAVCDGAHCAVLTSLARKAAASGATLFLGRAADKAASWKRIDLEADPGAPWKPYAIVSFDGTASAAWIALATKKKVALWRIETGRAELRGSVATPHGIYDIVMGSTPLVIGPGAPTNQPCGRDEFPIAITPLGGEPSAVVTQAAPDSVIARPLRAGAIMLWVAPVSCRMTSRVLVHGVLLAADGKPSGSPMSIADATGFAVATRGDALSVWLETRQGMAWLKAHCTA